CEFVPSSEAILSLDLRRLEAADARMNAPAGRHHQHEDDFIRMRGSWYAYLHRIEMRAHIGGVDMGDRHIELGARPADLLRRWNDGLGAAQHLAHGVAAGHMPERAVLKLAGRADDRAPAIGLDFFAIAGQ